MIPTINRKPMHTYRILILLLVLAALLAGCAQEPRVNEVALALTVAAVQTENAAGSVTQPTLAPSPTPAGTPTPGECLAEATSNNVNLRRDPDGAIIGCCLADGEELKVRDISADKKWALIENLEVPAHRGFGAFHRSEMRRRSTIRSMVAMQRGCVRHPSLQAVVSTLRDFNLMSHHCGCLRQSLW